MRGALIALALLASLLLPARATAACIAPVPVYPGAQQIGGPLPPPNLGVTSEGRTGWATQDSLLDIQMFYYIRLTNSGWTEVAQLPGQYPSQFQGGTDRGPINTVLPVLEFSRGDTAQRVRIVGEAGGYTVWLECYG